MLKNKWTMRAGMMILCAIILTACDFGGKSDKSEAGSSPTVAYASEINKAEIMSISIDADPDEWQNMLDTATEEEYISANVTINGTTIENVGVRPKGNSSLRQVASDEDSDRYSFKIKFDEYVDDQTWMGLDKLVVNNMITDNSYMKEYLSYDIMSYAGVDAPLFAFADISVNGAAWGLYLAVEDIDSGYLARAKNDEGELYKPNNDNSEGGMGGMPGAMPDGNQPAAGDAANQGNESAAENTAAQQQDSASTSSEGTTPTNGMTPPDGMALPDGATPPDMGTAQGNDGANGRPNGGMGGMMGGGNRGGGGGMNGSGNGVSLVYTDDEISSYSAIFDNAETKTTDEDYKRVIEALKNLNAGTDLEKYVDVDAVLRYFAAHTVVVNMDSYTSNMGHNYYLYENDGQISMLPWDYNMAFGGFQGGSASDVINQPIDTPVSGVTLEERPILGKLLEVPEYMTKYHEYLQKIVDGYFADGKFEEKVQSLNSLIADYVKQDPTAFNTYEEYETAVSELIKVGTLRAESIQGQLDGDIPSTTEGQQANADADALIDASSVDLTKLGSNGPGGGMGGGGNGFGRGGQGGFQGGQAGQGGFPGGGQNRAQNGEQSGSQNGTPSGSQNGVQGGSQNGAQSGA
ncbi:CotH kinase family protein [Paenibacillus sp. HB172176]|uniref:CotH kinase family protein n=1 Tax=Paenibacillus sp. HB172176 TaxID=2493690 RepID=UPI0023F6525D|nr:CotH kinase family protein [Paenibacillus sp. HB172176]